MKKIFDDFTLSAEVLPSIVVVMPIVVIGIYRGILSGEWKEASIELIIAVTLLSFLAKVVKERGKNYQEKMYKELGGMPTTIVFRFSDRRIDEVSKMKYHNWFNSKGNQYQLPMSLEEEEADSLSENKYINAMKDLRVYANSKRTEYPRVYQELKKYNYWRNLYGCKELAIVIYVVLIVREILCITNFQMKEIILNPGMKYSVFQGLILWTLIYCMFVRKRIVERSAFDYAVTLVENVCVTGEDSDSQIV